MSLYISNSDVGLSNSNDGAFQSGGSGPTDVTLLLFKRLLHNVTGGRNTLLLLISINNPRFKQFLKDVYPEELVVSETSESRHFVSYLDLLIDISNDDLVCSIFDKREAFDFDIVNFPDLSGDIPTAPAYGTYILQLIRYSRACHSYDNFSS